MSEGGDFLLLRELAEKFPAPAAAIAEIAGLQASLELPKPTVHVISDIHGEHKKLRHVLGNASGSLRPLVERLFADELDAHEQQDLLTVIYYPREYLAARRAELRDREWRSHFTRETLQRQIRLVRELAAGYRGRRWSDLVPGHHRELFHELLDGEAARRPEGYIDRMLEALADHDQDLDAIRSAARLVRNLSVAELVVGGDLGDRGARIDKVIDQLRHLPNVSMTWGNHDISWLGACLGQEALIATTLRMSLRYLRLWQLEEGYGVILSPLEMLVRACYRDDPAERFHSKRGATTRPAELVARMQKACAILQFKLEGALIQRHPEWEMSERAVLDRVDFQSGTLQDSDGRRFPLADRQFPTIDPADPFRLHDAEAECIARLRESFTASSALWEHMQFVVERGSMALVRDHAVIFHACIPVDADGEFLEVEADGRRTAGRALFDACERIVRRAYARGADEAAESDKDWFYYLWAGPRSPLFGKDRMATFETYFIDDPAAHRETKNPYFRLIHDREFAARICAEFGVTENGLLVNGHIPVKVEEGESPIKKGGNAVTIDGAFSEAYGDRGYTLILGPERAALAEHHHFDSIEEAIRRHADIIPKITAVRDYRGTRRVGDTREASPVHARIDALEKLVAAYREGTIR